MSDDPHLRCLLCDLILADDADPAARTEKCLQCGRKVLAGQEHEHTAAEPPLVPLERKSPPPNPTPPPADFDLEEIPEAKPVAPPPPAAVEIQPADLEDIPLATVRPRPAAPVDDVPVLQPRSRTEPPRAERRPPPLPPARRAAPQPRPRVVVPDPSKPDETRPARPQMGKALALLGCMTLLIVAALAVIAYVVIYFLAKGAKRVSVAEQVPALVVPAHPC